MFESLNIIFTTCRVAFFMLLFIFQFFLSKADAQHYYIKAYTVKDGLPNNQVESIFQDSRGYLWVSTYGGLSRFDGKSFINYDQSDGINSLGGTIYFEDSTGKLWISLQPEGACSFNGQLFKQYLFPNPAFDFWVFQLLQDANGKTRLLMGHGMYELEDTGWMKLNIFPKQPLTHFVESIQLNNGNILYNLSDSLVIQNKDGDSYTIARSNSVIKEFYYITKSAGNIYVSTWNHLWLLNDKKLVLLHDDVLANKNIRVVYKDKIGKLWVGTEGNGFYIFNGNSFVHYDLKHDKIYGASCFCEDNEGNVWVGTEESGLIKVKDSPVTFFYKDDKSKLNQVTSSYKEDNGNIVFASKVKGYSEWNGSQLIGHDNTISPNISSGNGDWIIKNGIAQDRQNRLWFATVYNRLLRAHDNKIEDITNKFGIHDKVLSILYNDADSCMYLSSLYGLMRIDKNDNYTIDTMFHLKESPINCLSIDSSYNLWMAFGKNNIWIKSKNKLKEIHKQLGIENVSPTKFYFSSANTLWIASGGKGIYRYHLNENNKWIQTLNISRKDGLIDNIILDIVTDKKNRIWIASASGLCSANFNNADTGTAFSITKYGDEIGFTIPANPYPSLTTDNTGNVWYGGGNYIACIKSNEIKSDTVSPRIQIENVELFSGSTDWRKYTDSFSSFFGLPVNPVMHYNENDISFEFNAICFSDDNNITYSYRLTGANKNWSKPQKGRHVTFANLSPGNYVFSVRAKKSQSTWSNGIATFAFEITPPYWQTWWFRLFILILISALIYVLYRYRMKEMIRIQNIRNKISSDLAR